MPQKSPATPRPKATRSANIELYLSPKRGSVTKPPQDDNFDKKSPSTRESDPNTFQDKSETSAMTTVAIESTIVGPPPSFPAGRRSTRKRPVDPSTSETTSHQASLAKKYRPSKRYAPPSTYAHLPALPDTITPNLLCLFVGLNPGIQTATLGHPYAHPSNLFWRLLHSSGLTPHRRLAPAEYVILPEQYSLGNTNIVGRATKDGAQLSKEEMVAGARILDEKVRKWQPEVVCLVGKSIWEAVWKWKYGRALRPQEFKYGFQDTEENMGRSEFGGKEGQWNGARVFVATSTSGLAASLSLKQKEEIWTELGKWVNKKREERKLAEGERKEDLEAATTNAVE